MTIAKETILVQNKEIITNMVDGQLGMMAINKGKYYSLDEIGADIWYQMDQPISVKKIIENLVKIYDISEEVCYNETKELLSELIGRDVIRVVE